MHRLSQNPEDHLERADIRGAVDALLADRRSVEARALYLTLARYIDHRVSRVARSRYPDLLPRPLQEELIGEVLLELMSGALAGFRGQRLPELLAYVRRICDRVSWRAAQRRIRERDTLEGEAAETVRAWSATPARPDAGVRMEPVSPLDEKDATYLLALLEAGSRSEHARREGVSRAAVTQRVQRIRRRISEMSEREQASAEAWMRRQADRVATLRED